MLSDEVGGSVRLDSSIQLPCPSQAAAWHVNEGPRLRRDQPRAATEARRSRERDKFNILNILAYSSCGSAFQGLFSPHVVGGCSLPLQQLPQTEQEREGLKDATRFYQEFYKIHLKS